MARVLFGTLLVGLMTPGLRADEVHFADGSKLVGTIESWYGGKLVIVTDIAGKLEIDVSKVTAVSSDRKLNFELTTGDRVIGTVSPGPAGQSTVASGVGEVPVAMEQVAAVWPEGADSPEVVAAKAAAAEEVAKYKPKWTVTLEAGAVMKEGNTETLDARGRLDIKRKTVADLLNFYLAADYSEQNDRRSKNEYRGGILFEGNITDRWYWYARTELEHDEFEQLDLRATAAAGVGYYWLKKEDHEFKTRGGAGYRHESFDNGTTRDEAILDLGYDYRVDVAPWLQFTHSTTYSPEVEDFDRYRLDVDTAMVFPLKKEEWSLKLGMRNEYNSRPLRGLERLDNTYYANVVVELAD